METYDTEFNRKMRMVIALIEDGHGMGYDVVVTIMFQNGAYSHVLIPKLKPESRQSGDRTD